MRAEARGRARAWLAGASLLAAVLLLGACSEPDGGGGVASLSGEGATSTTVEAASRDFNQARLEWAECMRDHGVDVPDPGSDGRLTISRGPGDNADFERAQRECGHLMQGVEPPGGLKPEDMQERVLAMTRCLRDKGFDVPDPQFSSEGGRVLVRQEEQAGVDVESDEFQDALDECRERSGMDKLSPPPGRGKEPAPKP